MTEERQAVKTLAEQLVKAMKSVSANTPSKYAVYAASAGSGGGGGGGGSAAVIPASRIIGLPAAFSSIISDVEDSAAGGDAIAQQTLIALNHIAAGEFETITADTAMIEKVYATFGDFITLVAENAQIGDLDVDTIRAGLAEVGLINIGTASIDMAQIKRSSTQTAFIHESVQGKVYIDDLAVNDASIVNLSAGTVLINDNNGNLVELYVNDQGDVSTRAVSYDGTDIIDQNSLNGNRIIQNSITTTQLNASEIFAARGMVMDLIADNIEATRLFANQGFIDELETTIIASDLSQNTAFIELTNSIRLLAQNTNQTYIQPYQPIPVHINDTWLNPATEQHYLSAGFTLFDAQFDFGHDSDGCLKNVHSDEYSFTVNSNGELMVLVTDEDAEQLISDHNIDFEIVDNYLYSDNLWIEVKNTAFSQLRIDVDGITSEVYSIGYAVFDPETGDSRIAQNADNIAQNRIVIVENSSKIAQNADSISLTVEKVAKNTSDISSNRNLISENSARITVHDSDITSAVNRITQNESDIAANGTAISQNADSITAESTRITNITNGTTAVPYVETSSIKIQNNKIEVKSTGDVDIKASNFSISFNTSGTATNKSRVDINNTNGIKVSDQYGNYFQATSGKIGLYDIQNNPKLYMDNSGHAFFNGSLTLGGANNTDGSLTIRNNNGDVVVSADNTGLSVYNSTGSTRQFYIDSTTGNATFAGNLSAATGTFAGTLSANCITSGTLSADRIGGRSIDIGKLSGTIGSTASGSWGIDFTTGTMSIGNISAGNITTGTFAVGGSTGAGIALYDQQGVLRGSLDLRGLKMPGLDIDVATGISQFSGILSADCITSGTLSADRIGGNSIGISKLSGTIGSTSTGDWGIDFTTGTISIGNISANNITSGTLAVGGSTGGEIAIYNANNTLIGSINSNGLRLNNNSGVAQFVMDSTTGNATFAGELSAATGTFYGALSAATGTFSGTLSVVTQVGSKQASLIINEYGNSNLKLSSNLGDEERSIELTNYGSITTTSYYGTTSVLQGGLLHLYGASNYLAEVQISKDNIDTSVGAYIDWDRLEFWDAGGSGGYVTTAYIKDGEFYCRGTKSRLVSTSQYSSRLLYCYETPSPMFGDVGEGVISPDGLCYISLDPIFAQTISTDQYQVFLQRYGEGGCYVSERHGSYFIVAGTPNLSFGWEIKAKQSDFDQLRLERNDEKFTVPSQTYGQDAANHIRELYNERTQQDKQESEDK